MHLEKDLLGTHEVPDDVYYGIQTMRAKENFPITGYRPHPELIKALAMVKGAAAEANCSVGTLNNEIGNAIVLAAREIMAGKLHDQFVSEKLCSKKGRLRKKSWTLS